MLFRFIALPIHLAAEDYSKIAADLDGAKEDVLRNNGSNLPARGHSEACSVPPMELSDELPCDCWRMMAFDIGEPHIRASSSLWRVAEV